MSGGNYKIAYTFSDERSETLERFSNALKITTANMNNLPPVFCSCILFQDTALPLNTKQAMLSLLDLYITLDNSATIAQSLNSYSAHARLNSAKT